MPLAGDGVVLYNCEQVDAPVNFVLIVSYPRASLSQIRLDPELLVRFICEIK